MTTLESAPSTLGPDETVTGPEPLATGPTLAARRKGRRATPRPPAPPRPPRRPEPDASRVVTTALLLLAGLALWALVQLLLLGGLSQARAQQVLHAQLREQLAEQTAPTGGLIDPGDPVALLSIPTLGLQQVVVEGTASGDLLAGPGHRRDTALPGQVGVSLVYGRSTTYGAPFRAVTLLREGDGITATTAQGEFTYRVDGVRRAGDPLPAPPAAGTGRLTLVATQGGGSLSAMSGFEVVYVDATLVGEAAVPRRGVRRRSPRPRRRSRATPVPCRCWSCGCRPCSCASWVPPWCGTGCRAAPRGC
ncbi:sortase domain-containing protein [Cellulomonas soli]